MESMRLLRAIGQDYRNDWSEFDGRTARSQLERVAELAEREHAGEDVKAEVDEEISFLND